MFCSYVIYVLLLFSSWSLSSSSSPLLPPLSLFWLLATLSFVVCYMLMLFTILVLFILIVLKCARLASLLACFGRSVGWCSFSPHSFSRDGFHFGTEAQTYSGVCHRDFLIENLMNTCRHGIILHPLSLTLFHFIAFSLSCSGSFCALLLVHEY